MENSVERSMRWRQRQREYVREIPTHCCARCSSILYASEAECLDCGVRRGPSGWTSLQDQADVWLARVIDGRYLITRFVGKGGSGRVYRAYSTTIQREFALKFVPIDSAAGPEIRARIEREVAAMGRLKNPHVVPFYEVLELSRHLVIVMDFVSGQSLQALCDAGPVDLRRVVGIAMQTANALFEAHTKGLVHRDIKPDNLMIERLPSGDDFVHVLDFGIVHEANSQLTRGFIGTPMFTSPEQASGAPVDPRSDIYALGAVMFYALTRVYPFDADTIMGVLQKHLSPTRPRLRDHLEVCPTALDELVGRMMSLAPGARPEDMGVVARELSRLLEVPSARSGNTSASDLLSESRAQIKDEVRRHRETHKLFGDQLAEADASSFATGVELNTRARLFGGHGKTPILLRNQDVLELAGQTPRLVHKAAANTSSLTFSGGTWLTGHANGDVRVQDEVVLRSTSAIVGVAGDQMGMLWVAASEDGRVWACTPTRRDKQWHVVRRGPEVTSLAVDKSGAMVAVARVTREVEILRAGGWEEVARIPSLSNVKGLAFSRDGYLLAILCERSVVIYETVSGRRLVAMRVGDIDLIWFENQGLLGYGWRENELWGWNLERSLR